MKRGNRIEVKLTHIMQDSKYFAHFRSRLKISFSKSRLNATVDELRTYNWDLKAIRMQLLDMATQLAQTPTPDRTNEIIADLNIARKASEKLHGLLVSKWVCSDRVQHMANLSLDVGGAQQCKFASRVKFHLSIRCISSNKNTVTDTIWVDVESATKISTGEAPRNGNLGLGVDQQSPRQAYISKSGRFGGSILKNSKSPVTTATVQASHNESDMTTEELARALRSAMIIGKQVSFDFTSVQTTPILSQSTTSNKAETQTGVSFSTIINLCHFFRTPLQQTSIGAVPKTLTETTNSFQHHLYASNRPQGCIDKTRSYKSILEDLAHSRRKIPWHEKFKLAQLLTLSVLRFRSTPWLQAGLSSNYLYFHESDISVAYDDLSSQGPCLQSQLYGKAPASEQKAVSRQKTALFRNELLFHLGVLLLEIGHDAPLQLLCQKEDSIQSSDASQPSETWLAEFLAAKRLGLCAAAQLNARYGKIARRCLDCDFGVGEDLDSPQLQQAVFVGVVRELDKCIEAEKKINLILGC